MPIITEPTKVDITPAAGLRAQLSPQRLRNEPQDTSFGQTEPNRNLLPGDKLITNEKISEADQSASTQQSTLDSVKQGFSAIPVMASNAAHQTAEFMKHIPEHAQQGAHATAEFMKHIPEHAQQGAHATAEFVKGIPEHAQQGAHATAEFVKGIHVPESVQQGLSATTGFVRHIPENVQHGAQATAEFMKHLPEQAKGALHLGAKQETTTAPKVDITPAEAGVPADDTYVQRAAPPASPYEYKTPTSLEQHDYLLNLGRSDSEGMHVHPACGAVKQHCVKHAHIGFEECSGCNP